MAGGHSRTSPILTLVIPLVIASALAGAGCAARGSRGDDPTSSDPHSYEGTPLALALPFRGGTYTILNGGSTRESNYHYWFPAFIQMGVNAAMRYAVDFAMVAPGDGSRQLAGDAHVPDTPGEGLGFGEVVYSPCDGVVSEVLDGEPDNALGQANLTERRGNHIVLTLAATPDRPVVYVAMLHLQKGSILVGVGERVMAGQPLARMGMSGQSYLPHLHIQASTESAWEGPGVPMLFDGEFLVRGDRVEAPDQ